MRTIPSWGREGLTLMMVVVLAACSATPTSGARTSEPGSVASSAATPARQRPLEHPDREARHLRNIGVLTSDGKSGEPYFSPDGKQIVFQSIRGPSPYYQIYVMNADGTAQRMVSTGRGKATCAFFRPDGQKLLYASTHDDPRAFKPGRDAPPEPPAAGERYRWDFDPQMEIHQAEPDGTDPRRLTFSPGYDAEGAYAPNSLRIVFTSFRDGDGDIYTMDTAGGDVRRVTRSPGYDGGPFFSRDGEWIVFRSFRFSPKGSEDVAEIMLIRPDGSDERQVTSLGVVSWGPFFHPDGRRIVFAANLEGSNFELYLVNVDGTGLERVTYESRFDGLPSFSPDGKMLVWTSNRGPAGDTGRGTSQVYLADWVD